MTSIWRLWQKKVLWYIIAGFILLSIVYLAYIFSYLIKVQVSQHNLKVLEYGSTRIERYFARVETVLHKVAFDPHKDSLTQEVRKELLYLLSHYPEFRNIELITADGHKISAHYYELDGQNMGKHSVQEANHNLDAVITVGVPLYYGKQFVGKINVGIDPDYITEMLKDIVQNEENMALTIFDQNKIALASSYDGVRGRQLEGFRPMEEALNGQRGFLSQISPVMDDKRLYVYGPLKKNGWVVTLSQPMQDVYGPWLWMFASGIPFVALSVIILWSLIRQVIRLENIRKIETLEFQAEKANAIAELAASVAHEIRNPITAIRGFMQLLSIRRDIDAKTKEYAEFIVEEVDNVEGIIGEFLSVAKPHATQRVKCDLQPVLRSVYMLAQGRALSNSVEVVFHMTGECLVLGDGAQLKQAFLNLCGNAVQAMPNGGTLTISAFCTKESVTVKIKDTGQGIQPQNIKRLGERFFTTKQEGSGLGLAVTYRIIENHHGKIDVLSTVGVGTEFTVTLPAYQKQD